MLVPPATDTTAPPRANHPDKLVQGDDEGYVDYLTRQGDAWSNHPPAAPEGFELIPCEATPRHWPTYTVADDDFYPACCLHCAYDVLARSHDGCEHAHHRVWRRWKITGRVAGWLYTTGLTAAGGSWRMGGGCPGCYTMPKWNRNRRPYILGVSRETWHCLLRRRHRPTITPYGGFCTKCLPCADCGSTDPDHYGCGY